MQALGAGGMVAVSMAVVKDAFYGTTKNRVLALVQAMAVIAPMVAPVIGAFLLQFVSWRGTFGVLIATGAFLKKRCRKANVIRAAFGVPSADWQLSVKMLVLLVY